MANCKAILEERLPYSLKCVNGILNRDKARASCLDILAYAAFIDELTESWNVDTNMACCVVNKNNDEETPLAIAIIKRAHRDSGYSVTELNWERT